MEKFEMMKKLQLFPLISMSAFLMFLLYSDSSTLYDLSIKKVACQDFDPRISFPNSTCRVRKISRKVAVIDYLIYLQPGSELDDLYVLVELYQRTNNVYRRNIISLKENFCGYLAGTSKSFLISILWRNLQKASNIPSKCPMKMSGDRINITGLQFDEKYLPPVLPEGEARLDIHVRFGPQQISVMKTNIFIDIKPKGAFKLDF